MNTGNSATSKFVVPLLVVIAVCAAAITVTYVVLPAIVAIQHEAEKRKADEAAARARVEWEKGEESARRWLDERAKEEKEEAEMRTFAQSEIPRKIGKNCLDVVITHVGLLHVGLLLEKRYCVEGYAHFPQQGDVSYFFSTYVRYTNGQWVCEWNDEADICKLEHRQADDLR